MGWGQDSEGGPRPARATEGPGRVCRWRTETPVLARHCALKTAPRVQASPAAPSQPLLPFYSALEP